MNSEKRAVAEFARGILRYVEDGNVLEVRECGFVEELQAAIAAGSTYSVIHISSGEEVAGNFLTESDAYSWLKTARLLPSDINEYSIEREE